MKNSITQTERSTAAHKAWGTRDQADVKAARSARARAAAHKAWITIRAKKAAAAKAEAGKH